MASSPQQVVLKTTCRPCALSRVRCVPAPLPVEGAGPSDTRCARCRTHNVTTENCVFEPARKRGPRGPRIKQASDGEREREGESGRSDSGGERESPPRRLRPTPPQPPLPLLPPLPDSATLNLAMGRYLRSLYMSLPLAVRSELFIELDRGFLPDFCAYSLLFWTFWFDPELNDYAVSGEQRRHTLRLLFRRIELTMRPAIETVLAGASDNDGDNETLRSQPRWLVDARDSKRQEHRSMAVSVCLSLLHLIDVALAFRDPQEEPYADVQRLVDLVVAVGKASKINSAQFYRRSTGGRTCVVKERARRAWWSIAIADIQLAVMTGTPGRLPADESLEVGMQIGDNDFEEMRRAAMVDVVSSLQEQAPPEAEVVDNTAGGATISTMTIFSNVLNNSFRPDGTLSYPHHHMRVFFLVAQAVEYRRTNPDPSSTGPGRDSILINLTRWFADLSPEVQTLERGQITPEALLNAAATLGGGVARDDLPQLFATMLYTLIVFHTAHVILASPGGESWADPMSNNRADWLVTPSFATCEDHARKATRLLLQFLTVGNAGHVGKPFFQYCVVRTGLVHLWKAAVVIGLTEAEANQHAVLLQQQQQEALANMRVHSAILQLAHEQLAPVAANNDGASPSLDTNKSRSHWYKVWVDYLASLNSVVVG